jgi:hypothetical protein
MSAKWWAVYHRGECVTRVAALSEQAALNVVREYSHLLDIDDNEIQVVDDGPVDHDAVERSRLGLLPYFSQEIGPEFSEPGPAVPGKEA